MVSCLLIIMTPYFPQTFAMLIGEIELVRIFIDKDKNAVIVPFTSHIVVALFIIFISIILSSLFIALAVSDISSMQREGETVHKRNAVRIILLSFQNREQAINTYC